MSQLPPIQKVTTASPQVLPSVIRTLVALAAGFAVTQLLRLGIKLDTATAEGMIEPVVTAGYYTAVRYLETNVHPAWGYLLGVASQPHYLDPAK